MLPNINDVLYILPASAADKPEYKARVSELDETRIWIEVPLQEQTRKFGLFHTGEILEITYIQPDGMKCHFLTSVVGSRQDGIRMLALSKPDPEHITKMQRRSFLRVDSSLELAIRTPEDIRFVVHTEDISGGGASFIAETAWGLQEQQHLSCWIVLPFRNDELEYVQFNAEIVRIQAKTDKHSVVMLKFSEISEGDQQKVIRYCFERQLEARKRV
ncbi:flagellar brake protein [Paenibacillus marinisediminis]